VAEAGATPSGSGPGWSGPARAAERLRLRSALSGLLLSSRFLPVWLATTALVIVAAIIAPAALRSTSWAFVFPVMAVLAVAALGAMLVIMQAGIDLSVPGVIFLGGNLILGVSEHSNGRLVLGILACIGLGLLVGLSNGLFVGILRLNPLIVTLAVGGIVLAFGARYARQVSFETAVPPGLKSWALSKPLGISWVFWLGAILTIFVALCLRYTAAGRRFQAVGANPRAAWMAGIHVRTHVVFAYTAAGGLYAAAAVLLAGVRGSIDFAFGAEYLLAPIAAVVIAGASLAGGLASVTSTWVAALALTLLSQVLLVLGLSPAMQYVVFGAAILAGMIVSGDRIAAVLGKVLQHPRAKALFGPAGSLEVEERRDPAETTARG
jgi:ribose transport system permease protein